MTRTAVQSLRVLLLICAILAPAHVNAQRRQQTTPQNEDAYGSMFFDQLRSIFGKFRTTDLQRAFQAAEAIQCSEVVGGKGEWREVAFFNDNRRLGEWCRENIEEVKSDLSVFGFTGECRGDRGTVQVSTEFPIADSIEAYNKQQIGLDQVDVNVNAPVNAVFDSRTLAYTFELPYLFRTGREDSINLYSFMAPHRNAAYATDVTSRWECKSVNSEDVTYRFLICRAETVPRNPAARGRNREASFGASAFFILSDGTEAHTGVNLTFGGVAPPVHAPPGKQPTAASATRAPTASSGKPGTAGVWLAPDVDSKVADAGNEEFRLRFNLQTWNGKIGSAQLLSDQKLSSFQSSKPPEGMDYCVWRPEGTNLADRLLLDPPGGDISYSLDISDQAGQSPASIVFVMKTAAGSHLGALQCFFPRATFAASVSFGRWISVVGGHLMLEVRK